MPLACPCNDPLVCDASGSCCSPIRCIDVCQNGSYDGPDGCGNVIHCDPCSGGPD
jgi:hypothetical protein